jgi:hypothetical protein
MVVQHYQAGFRSGKSTPDQLFALRQRTKTRKRIINANLQCHTEVNRATNKTTNEQHCIQLGYTDIIGRRINESKTQYMIAAGNDRTIHDVGQSVAFGDKIFEVVKEFVYLGSLVTPNNNVSLEIQ